jgi:hypothetical protein
MLRLSKHERALFQRAAKDNASQERAHSRAPDHRPGAGPICQSDRKAG